MRNKIFIFILFLFGAAAGYYLMNIDSYKNVEIDPVSFSHYVHTKQHKIKCVTCHRGVLTQERAEVPNINFCSMCHSTLINPSSKREKTIFEFVKRNETIPWKINYYLPDYVYFSHIRHVKLGKLDCSACHGNMSEQDSPQLKNFSPMKMQFCFDCHEEKGITTDCGNCHH